MRRSENSLAFFRRHGIPLLAAAALLFALNLLLHPLFHAHKESCGDGIQAQELCLVCDGFFQAAEPGGSVELPRQEPPAVRPSRNDCPVPASPLPLPCSRAPPAC